MDVSAYARQLVELLPRGAAWAAEMQSDLRRLIDGIAEEYARVDARSVRLIDETDPRTVIETLGEWERALGLPDLCIGPQQTISQRVAAVAARYASTGGQSRAYYISVAAALGFTVTITEFHQHTVNDNVDHPIYGVYWVHAWQINAPLETVHRITVKDAVDEPLVRRGNQSLECTLRALAPAHTSVRFSYGAV